MLEQLKNWLVIKLDIKQSPSNVATSVAEDYALEMYKVNNRLQEELIAELKVKLEAYEAQQGNDVLAEIQQLFVAQTEKGICKYGDTVRVENLTAVEWCQHALEEQADSMVYLSSLKKRLERGEY